MSSNQAQAPAASLFSRGMLALIIAQFFAALADNAILFGAIAMLRARHAPAWHLPLLQEFFVLAFILMAPFVGPLADAFPKARVMFYSNGLKLFSALLMLTGMSPLFPHALIGVGAAAYSPSKYGLLTEMFTVDRLVKANSLIESSTIVAILIGTFLGGWLSDFSPHYAILFASLCYLIATLGNLLIPSLPPETPFSAFQPGILLRDFLHSVKTLYSRRDSRFSLMGTGLFWGGGSALRFLLVAWVPVALQIYDNTTPALLSGLVGIGIAIGAALAARLISLRTINRTLPAGLLMGLMVLLLAGQSNLRVTEFVMVLIGTCGGAFVVPLNALLQEAGHHTTGTGHAIAVQNLNENSSMLVFVGFYTLLLRLRVPVIHLAIGFGIVILAGIFLLAFWRLKK